MSNKGGALESRLAAMQKEGKKYYNIVSIEEQIKDLILQEKNEMDAFIALQKATNEKDEANRYIKSNRWEEHDELFNAWKALQCKRKTSIGLRRKVHEMQLFLQAEGLIKSKCVSQLRLN